MKKMKYLFLGLMGLAFGVTSCENPEDENPRYQDPTEFVVNESPYKDALIELNNTKNIIITCSQPDYGYAAAAEYAVQVSLDDNWEAENGFDEAVQTLGIKSNSAEIAIDANELAVMLCSLMGVVDENDVESAPIPVYLRVKCSIPNIAGSEIYSNSIVLNKVVPYYALPDVNLPEAMYMIGNFCSWDWKNAATMVPVYDNPDLFWTIRYVKEGEGFKFNSNKAWDGGEVGFDQVTVVSSVVTASSDGGNIAVDKSGWYIFAVKSTIEGRDILTEVQIMEPNVYVYGAANGGTWGNDANWKFDVIDDPDAEWPFVSPKVLKTDGTDDSCLRLCIHPDEWSGIDWWKSEFIFFDGEISYRGKDGDQTRVGNPEGKVYLNFVTGKAKVE